MNLQGRKDLRSQNLSAVLERFNSAGDTLSSRHVSSHKTYVLISTPSLSLPMRLLFYADLYNLVT